MAPTKPLQGSKGNGNGHRVRGVRDAQDIIDAAIEQGWTFDRSSNHYRLVPPGDSGNGSRGVGISGTPSDINYRQQIVRCLRRTGQFQWPWPPVPPKTIATQMPDLEPTFLDWRPVPHCSAYEFCQAGVVRNKLTLQIITPAENGNLPLSDDKGKMRYFSARALCRAAFNHGPIEKLVCKAKEETIMTAARAVEINYAGLDGDEELVTTPVSPEDHWEIVLIEGVVEGYEVNEAAVVKGPPHHRTGERKVLVSNNVNRSRRIVQLRRTDGKFRGYLLDEIVLEAFETRPAPHWVPEYIDGDKDNCARSNLRWVEGKLPKPPKIPEETPVTTSAGIPAVNPSVESIVDTAQKAARVTIEQEEVAMAKSVQELREASWPLPAEAYHLDYPSGSRREGRCNDPKLEVALGDVVHPTSFVTMSKEELTEAYNRGYANAEDVATEREIDAAVASGELSVGARALEVQAHLNEAKGIDDVFAREIANINLKIRSYNILHREGISTVGDLMKHTEAEIRELRNAGEIVVEDIRRRLADLGLVMDPGTPTPVVVEASDIVSYHVHEHRPSGLILKVHGDGRVEQPVIKAHQMSILTQLLAAAADL